MEEDILACLSMYIRAKISSCEIHTLQHAILYISRLDLVFSASKLDYNYIHNTPAIKYKAIYLENKQIQHLIIRIIITAIL